MDKSLDAVGLCGIKKHLCSENIRLNENCRTQNAPINVGLGSKVDHSVDLEFRERIVDCSRVADIRFHENITGVGSNLRQVLQIPCVGEIIEVYHPEVCVLFQEVTDEIATDEAGTTRDENILHDSVENKYPVWVVFVPDLIHLILPPKAGEEAIREVDNPAGDSTYIFVGVNHSSRDDDDSGKCFPDVKDLSRFEGRGVFSVIPEVESEVGWTNERKIIGLICMLVRASRHPRFRHGNIAHHRKIPPIKFVLPEELCQPPALIRVLDKILDDYVMYRSTLEHEIPFESPLSRKASGAIT